MTFAIIFPGQASQYVGMLADLATKHSVIQKCFSEASEILGYDLWDVSQNDPRQEINQTIITQPAILYLFKGSRGYRSTIELTIIRATNILRVTFFIFSPYLMSSPFSCTLLYTHTPIIDKNYYVH